MSNETYPSLRIEKEAGVAFVTLDHPPLNLLDASLMQQLDRLAASMQRSGDVRVIVFESADADFFIAHGDMEFIKDPEAFGRLELGDEVTRGLNPMMRLHERIRALPQITIGKLAGIARGGGSEFLMALDMRFAAEETAGLAQMETPTGIIPGAGATAYLPGLVGRARALEIILGADLFDARTAERYGWINRAMPRSALDAFVAALARRIAGLPPGVLEAARTAIDAAIDLPLAEALRIENDELGVTFSKPAAAKRTLEILRKGAQTRAGELGLEALLRSL